MSFEDDVWSIEKNGFIYTREIEIASVESTARSRWGRFIDSYKPQSIAPLSASLSRYEKAIYGTVRVPIYRRLTTRHVQMIALGSVVGDGLFVSSRKVLMGAGPLGLILCYLIFSVVMVLTILAAGELTVEYPVSGAISAHCSRLIDHSWGFAIGWMYTVMWLLYLPTELTAMTLIIIRWQSWMQTVGCVHPAVWLSISLLSVAFVHLHSLRMFAEVESVFTVIKVLGVVAFIIFGIVAMAGGAPNNYAYGFRLLEETQILNGFRGIAYGLLSSSYAFLGAEVASISVVEAEHPQLVAPRANKQMLWRLIGILLVSITVVCCLVPYNTAELATGSSPFVLAIGHAGSVWFAHTFALIMVLSTWSGANAGVFAASRSLVALAAQSHAPRFLLYIDQQGRPLVAILISLTFGLLGFASLAENYLGPFDWLTAIMGVSGLFMWLSINICHVRFRVALRSQGKRAKDLLYRSVFGIWGSMFSTMILFALFGIMMFASCLQSASTPLNEATPRLFFRDWLCLCLLLTLFAGHKIWFRDPIIRSKEINLDTGSSSRSMPEMWEAVKLEKEAVSRSKWWYKIYRIIC